MIPCPSLDLKYLQALIFHFFCANVARMEIVMLIVTETEDVVSDEKVEELVSHKVKKDEPYEFTIKSIFKSLKDHMRFIIIITMGSFLLTMILAYVYDSTTRSHTGYARALISLGFPNAEHGLDPFGAPLNISANVQSPYVIGRTIDALEFRQHAISAADIRSNMRIAQLTPHHALDSILIMRDSAARLPERLIYLEDIPVHPTEFLIQIYRGSTLSDLSAQQMVDLLNEIINQYSLFFIDTYSNFHFMDAIVGQLDHSGLDYFEMIRILRRTMYNMISYIDSMQELSPDFRSPTTGMTFGDISASLDIINTTTLFRVRAIVDSNNMSRDRALMADILEYDLAQMQRELAVSLNNAEKALYLVRDVYERETWVYTHQSMEDYLTFQRGSFIYEDLINDARRFSFRAHYLEQQIAYYQNRVNSLRSARNPVPQDRINYVEGQLSALFESLHDWENIINQTVEDFLSMELYRDAISLVFPASFSGTFRSTVMNIGVFTVAGTMFGLFMAILLSLVRDAIADSKAKYENG